MSTEKYLRLKAIIKRRGAKGSEMKITKSVIKNLTPCNEGWKWYLSNQEDDLETLLLNANTDHPEWARWLFTHLMSKKQCVEIAIFAAKEVLPIYEGKHSDKRPRLAIEAAEKWLKEPTEKNAAPASASASAASASAASAYDAYAAYAAYDASASASAASAASAYAAYAASASASASAASADAYAAYAYSADAYSADAYAAYAYAAYAYSADAYSTYAAAAAAASADAYAAYAYSADAYSADADKKHHQVKIIKKAIRILDTKGTVK